MATYFSLTSVSPLLIAMAATQGKSHQFELLSQSPAAGTFWFAAQAGDPDDPDDIHRGSGR